MGSNHKYDQSLNTTNKQQGHLQDPPRNRRRQPLILRVRIPLLRSVLCLLSDVGFALVLFLLVWVGGGEGGSEGGGNEDDEEGGGGHASLKQTFLLGKSFSENLSEVDELFRGNLPHSLLVEYTKRIDKRGVVILQGERQPSGYGEELVQRTLVP